MTSVVIPGLDLVPSLPSRVVTVDLVDMTEGEQVAGAKIDFFLPADLHVPADDKILQAGRVTLTLNASGHGEIRLPAFTDTVHPSDWVIGVKKHWAPHPYYIRVPAGSTAISLADIPAVQTLPQGVQDWMITGASATVTQGSQWDASLNLTGGILHLGLTVPPGGTAWVKAGSLADHTDLNSLTSPNDAGIYALSSNRTYPNNPFPGVSSKLTVEANGLGVVSQTVQRYGMGRTLQRHVINFYSNPISWSDWEEPNKLLVSESLSPINLDEARTTQDILIPNSSVTVEGWPAGLARRAGHVQVRSVSSGITFQQLHTYGPEGTLLIRQTSSVGSSPFPWTDWVDLRAVSGGGGGAGGDLSSISNALRIQDWSRRRGGRRKVSTGAVALRFSHGLANFNSIVRPIVEDLELPYCLAINSANWGHPENSGVTAAMVNTWVEGGLCEIWNHGRTHNGAQTEAGWRSEIGTGLSELQSQIPAAEIDGFVIPGTGGVGYGDFGSGQSAMEFASTPAGRFILEMHAVSTGYISGTHRRVLDGTPRQGQAHFTMDAQSESSITAEIATAQSEKSGLQFMLHPSQINTGSNITATTLTNVLQHIADERDANRLAVLSPYDLLLAETV